MQVPGRRSINDMRDAFADEAHFLNLIQSMREAQSQSLERIRRTKAAGTFKERRPGVRLLGLWDLDLRIFESRYSLGIDVSELQQEFSILVEELPGLEAFNSYQRNDTVVTLCSLAVLFDDNAAAARLASLLERDGAFHTRACALLSHFDIPPEVKDPRNGMDEYWMGEARVALTQGDSERASSILHKYVDELWFEYTYESGLRVITHERDQIGHVGYWCYEGAAFAKVAGIDDSRLEGHKYYPWDLAHP